MSKVLSIIIIFLCLAQTALSDVSTTDYKPAFAPTERVISLDGDWAIATDPQNRGREEQWWADQLPQTKSAPVPGIIQEVFPAYHGVAWYWRSFTPPKNPDALGRYILRFWAVDYKAEVWLNGIAVGGHENGETPFDMDVTHAIQPGQTNILAVRVLNPTDEPIDGITLAKTAHRNKVSQFRAGASFNQGGIIDSVELMLTSAVRIVDVFIQPDWTTGKIPVELTVRNTLDKTVAGDFTMAVAPGAGGETLNCANVKQSLRPGDTVFHGELSVAHPRYWQLDDPYLYRVTVTLNAPEVHAFDEYSHKCGFRDFSFKDGYFRLNGKRFFLKGSHTGNHFPIGICVPRNPDWIFRDLLNSKAMGFNMIRFIAGMPLRRQLDYADEIGLLVYDEPMASWCMEYSDHFGEWYDRAISEMILRDRNHVSVVIWGLLNEIHDGWVVSHAVKTLDLIRSLDRTRMVLLNSGKWDNLQNSSAMLPDRTQGWSRGTGVNPSILCNQSDKTVETAGGVWSPGQLGLLSGMTTEITTIRWTAPANGQYDISVRFSDISQKQSTTGVAVILNGKNLFTGKLNLDGQGKEQRFSDSCTLRKNDIIDFAVDQGEMVWLLPYMHSFTDDVTVVEALIKSTDGKTYDAAGDFSFTNNPNASWSYGVLRDEQGKRPSAFALLDRQLKGNIAAIGSASNPYSTVWENTLEDWHYYPSVPQSAEVIDTLRTMSEGRPVFISEYGVGGGINWIRAFRLYQQNGYPDVEDALFTKARADEFLADFQRWHMKEVFGRPEEFCIQSIDRMANLRIEGINALRSNPHMVGYSVTGTVDQGMAGEGHMATAFRELKTGITSATVDSWAPLRWCTFAEPYNAYRNEPVRLEAVLANEDILKPGSYPVHLWVFSEDNQIIWERCTTVNIPDPKQSGQPPFAIPVFKEDVRIDAPTGRYRWVVSFESGAAAAGGQSEFYIFDAVEMPVIEPEIVLWGNDPELSTWLAEHGAKVRAFDPSVMDRRELLVVVSKPDEKDEADAFGDLAKRIARGSSAIFLEPSLLKKEDQSGGWLPLQEKPKLITLDQWLYHSDAWARNHRIFQGLQSGGLLDYMFYRELIPNEAWSGGSPAEQVVAGANDISWRYSSGMLIATYRFGDGRFTLNTMWIRKHLGRIPQAERLLRNLINDAGKDLHQPLSPENTDLLDLIKDAGF